MEQFDGQFLLEVWEVYRVLEVWEVYRVSFISNQLNVICSLEAFMITLFHYGYQNCSMYSVKGLITWSELCWPV